MKDNTNSPSRNSRLDSRNSNLASRWLFLSYPLNPESPTYGGGHGFTEQKDKQIEQGDSCNTSLWTMSSHMGTHIDFPRHFTARGPAMDDYGPDFFIFGKIHIIDIGQTEPGTVLGTDALDFSGVPEETELLLVKTGFCKYRGDPVYWQQNPGFHPDIADYLRQNLPALRVLGFDSISLSSFANRELGRRAHRSFLDNDRPILPLEDMDLNLVDSTTVIYKTIIAPLRAAGADGAPCTVFAMIRKE